MIQTTLDLAAKREYLEGMRAVDCFKRAEKYGLAAEYMIFYTRAIREGKSVDEAATFVLSEWDLI